MHFMELGLGYGPAWMPAAGFAFAILMLWSIFWKGVALWHSARRGEHIWFIVLMIINTAGLLEIVYLLFVAKIPFRNLLSEHSQKQ